MINILYNDDCLKVLTKIKSNSVDLILTDPPYFLSNGGYSINNGKVVSVDKGSWDKAESEEWKYNFTKKWMSECKRIMKEDGSLFITGTSHNIFDIYNVSKLLGLRLVNFITWNKPNPPPLIYKNKFRFSAEQILWLTKGRNYKFNYEKMYSINNEEMTDTWVIPSVSKSEKIHGRHPTQKPIELMKRIIMSCSQENDVILDPFMGSGTTCLAAKQLGRKYIGIEKEEAYYKIAQNRLQ